MGPQPQACPSLSPLTTLATQTHELFVIGELLEWPLDEDVVGPEDALSAL